MIARFSTPAEVTGSKASRPATTEMKASPRRGENPPRAQFRDRPRG
jgi:hypothetical protein